MGDLREPDHSSLIRPVSWSPRRPRKGPRAINEAPHIRRIFASFKAIRYAARMVIGPAPR